MSKKVTARKLKVIRFTGAHKLDDVEETLNKELDALTETGNKVINITHLTAGAYPYYVLYNIVYEESVQKIIPKKIRVVKFTLHHAFNDVEKTMEEELKKLTEEGNKVVSITHLTAGSSPLYVVYNIIYEPSEKKVTE